MANSIQDVENAINDGKHIEIAQDGTVNVGAAEVLADQIEKKEALIQAVTFDVTTDVADFRLFTYTVRFAEKTP